MEDAGGSGGFIWQGKGGNLFYPTPTLHESRPGYKIRNCFEHTQKKDLDKTHELMMGRGLDWAKRGIFQGVPPPLCMKP